MTTDQNASSSLTHRPTAGPDITIAIPELMQPHQPTGDASLDDASLDDASLDDESSTWPVLTEPALTHWVTPHIDVVVDVVPGEDISAALLAAARDEIELFLPVNVEEFDVTITPD